MYYPTLQHTHGTIHIHCHTHTHNYYQRQNWWLLLEMNCLGNTRQHLLCGTRPGDIWIPLALGKRKRQKIQNSFGQKQQQQSILHVALKTGLSFKRQTTQARTVKPWRSRDSSPATTKLEQRGGQPRGRPHQQMGRTAFASRNRNLMAQPHQFFSNSSNRWRRTSLRKVEVGCRGVDLADLWASRYTNIGPQPGSMQAMA